MNYTASLQARHWTHLSKNLMDRLENGKHTDCTFIIGADKTEFELNRFILSLISPVFEAMLYGNMRESENDSEIIIADIDVEAFECVISYSYGNNPNITLKNVTALLSICDKYQILELLKIANEFFHSSLNAKTFCVLFNESIKIKSVYCINLCIDFVKQTYLKFDGRAHSEIMKSSYILNVNAMKVLLESDYILIKEEKVWEAYINWLNHQNENNLNLMSIELEPQSQSKSVDKHKLYKWIRFGLMDNRYFIKSVLPKKILSDSELVDIMKYSICKDELCGEFDINPRGKDIWSSLMGDCMKIDDDNCLIHKGIERSSQTALLAMEFMSGIHKWKFKIIKLKIDIGDGSDWTSSIGIYKINNSKDLPINNHFIWDEINTGYGFCAHSGKLKEYDNVNAFCMSKDYGVECKNNDIIEMIVDMDKLEMKYVINGIDYGKAFDIQKEKYRAAINLDIPDDSIQLL